MGEPAGPPEAPEATLETDLSSTQELTADAKPRYTPYRPAGSEYTPPASPQPPNVFGPPAARKSFGASRSKHPRGLRMDTAALPAYERPTYSPSPSSSPPLPPAIPSPHFLPRQRAPSILRHTAASSPLNAGFPRAEQAIGSPALSPSIRNGSGNAPPSDARVIFNPLASNPVDRSGPAWGPSEEELAESMQTRPRGFTSSSQPAQSRNPPLRSATSIPDYGPFRGTEKPNLSGAYRPNRGGANWSHNDQHPLRHFRPDEGRTSYRSGWTYASSSFVDTSGTERSSMATGRSSVSDTRASVYSGDQSGDTNISSDSIQAQTADEDEDMMSAVDDVIDSYWDRDDEEVLDDATTEEVSRLSSSPVASSITGPLEFSRSQSSDPASYQQFSSNPFDPQSPPRPVDRQAVPCLDPSRPHDSPIEHHTEESAPKLGDSFHIQNEYLPPLQLSPLHLQYSPAANSPMERVVSPIHKPQSSISPIRERQPFREIYNELKELPSLPKVKSRMSRQDWAGIQAYSRKHSRGPSILLQQSEATSPETSFNRPALAVHIPPTKPSNPLPEVDEDEAYPRRASTSVFDRRSTLMDLNKAIASATSPPPTSRTLEFANVSPVTGKRHPEQTLQNHSPVSPTSPVYRLPKLTPNASLAPVARDRYGFKKANHTITPTQYDAWYDIYERYVSRRRGKWIALMDRNGCPIIEPTRFPERSEKVRRYARKGYPPEWRGEMWWFYSGGPKRLQEMSGLYASLVARINQGELNKDDREAIERDLDRTFPDNIHFRPDATPDTPSGKPHEDTGIVRDLRQVLQCFALNNPNIGYCQSLNFIAGLLLLFTKRNVERVFVLLTIITQQHLPGAHARNLANTEVNVLMMLIKDYLPKVWASINDTDFINSGAGSHAHPSSKFQRQPTVALSCTSWFMSLFVGVLPIEVVLRVWDAFLYEGPRALFRYALAIFKLGEPEIKKFAPGDGELFMTVQNLPRQCLDPNILHDLAFVKKGFGSLSQNVIDQKMMYWQQEMARQRSGRKPAAQQTPKPGLMAVKTEGTGSSPGDEDKKRGGGLRRKASRRLFRRDREKA